MSYIKDMFESSGSGKPQIQKIIMFIGAVVCQFCLVYQTVLTGLVPYDIFFMFIGATLGANSVNKAISATQDVYEQKYAYEADQDEHEDSEKH